MRSVKRPAAAVQHQPRLRPLVVSKLKPEPTEPCCARDALRGFALQQDGPFRRVHEGAWTQRGISGKYSDYLIRTLVDPIDCNRATNARKWTRRCLIVNDLHDATAFWEDVLRLESARQIEHSGQRDHSVHTVWTYLLGWYIYSNSETIRKQVGQHLDSRGANPDSFGLVWRYFGLLHDVGYLLAIPSTAADQRALRLSVKSINRWFSKTCWKSWDIEDETKQAQLRQLAGVEPPAVPMTNDPASIVRGLSRVGDLRKLLAAADSEIGEGNERRHRGKLPRVQDDAFTLWQANYRFYDQPVMADRVDAARTLCDLMLQTGIPTRKGTLRLLDHGVCGALLLACYATWYYRLRFGLPATRHLNRTSDRALVELFTHPKDEEGLKYHAATWWRTVVWATAAVGLHNVLQMPRSHFKNVRLTPLNLNEDPLTYLGVLADCVQEWDRPYASASRRPVLSSDKVKLWFDGRRVVVRYPSEKYSLNVKKTLNRALRRWSSVIRIEP